MKNDGVLRKAARIGGMTALLAAGALVNSAAGAETLPPGGTESRTILVENGEEEELAVMVLPAAGIMVNNRLDGDVLEEMYQLNREDLRLIPPGDWRVFQGGTEALLVVGQYPPETGKTSSPLAVSWLPGEKGGADLRLSREDIPSVKMRGDWPEGLRAPAARADGEPSEWRDIPAWIELNPETVPPMMFAVNKGRIERRSAGEKRPGAELIPASIKGRLQGGTFSLYLEGISPAELWIVPHRDRTRAETAHGVYQASAGGENPEKGRLLYWDAPGTAVPEGGKGGYRLAGRWSAVETGGWEIDLFLGNGSAELRQAWEKGKLALDIYTRREGSENYWNTAALNLQGLEVLNSYQDVINGGG